MSKAQQQKAVIFAPKITSERRIKARSFKLSAMIGLIASVATSILVIWVFFFQSDNNIEIEITTVAPTSDGRLELQGLTYKGQTKSGDDYVVIAAKAAEDARNANLVHLDLIEGEITNLENGEVTLVSNQGQFDQVKNFITLIGDVVITQSARQLTFVTQELSGDLNLGDFTAPKDVLVTSPTSTISSEAMDVTAFGETIIFKGQSKAIIGEDENS